MPMSNGARRVCGNIYSCTEAARFFHAKTLHSQKDRCGCCTGGTTYADFMQHGWILCCRMCTRLSGAKAGSGRSPQELLGECLVRGGRHCPLCALEYVSLAERNEDWLSDAEKVLRCFLGGPSSDCLAKDLYDIVLSLTCSRVRSLLSEILAILEDGKRVLFEKRILEASRILDLELLPAKRSPARAAFLRSH